jgi:hypothetical protein
MPIIPIALPIDEAPVAPARLSPLHDPLFASGGALTMKISRAALAAEGLGAAGQVVDPPSAPAPPLNFDGFGPPTDAVPAVSSFPNDPLLVAGPTGATLAPGILAEDAAAAIPFWLDFLVPVIAASGTIGVFWLAVLGSCLR